MVMNMSENEQMEGTTCVGVVGEDGVAVATDKQVSGVVQSRGKKVYQIHPQLAVATSGLVSDCQIIAERARKNINMYRFERGRQMTAENAVKSFTDLARFPSYVIPLLAGYDEGESYLARYDMTGSRVEDDEFLAIGSGSQIAIGSIEENYEPDMSVRQARDVAVGAIESTAEHGIYTGEAIDVAVIDQDGVNIELKVVEL